MKAQASQLFIFMSIVIFACRDDAATGTATATPDLNELPPAEAARRVAERPEENTVMLNQLQGTWLSLDGSGTELVFSPDGRKEMRYEMRTDGAGMEGGRWESPSDCTSCGLTNTDICFVLLADGGKRTCCNVVRMDSDTLQYFIVGSAGGARGFARVRQ